MTIEPHNVRFQIGTRVLPPMPVKPFTKPKLTLAQDAALINKRLRRASGVDRADPANQASARAALEARERQEQAMLEAVRKADRATARDVAETTGVGYDRTLNILRVLFKAGKIKHVAKTRFGTVWSVA